MSTETSRNFFRTEDQRHSGVLVTNDNSKPVLYKVVERENYIDKHSKTRKPSLDN